MQTEPSRRHKLEGIALVMAAIGVLMWLAGVNAQESLFPRVAEVRGAITGTPTPEQLGEIINLVAWENRGAGWGLSAKPNGHNCPAPNRQTRIACDILHHKPTNTLWDALTDSGATWIQASPHNDPNRPWLAPTDPGGVTPPPPPPVCGWPDQRVQVAELRDEVNAKARRIAEQDGDIERFRADLERVTRERDAAVQAGAEATAALATVRCSFQWRTLTCVRK